MRFLNLHQSHESVEAPFLPGQIDFTNGTSTSNTVIEVTSQGIAEVPELHVAVLDPSGFGYIAVTRANKLR